MGTEADPLDVLVELTEKQVVVVVFFFPAYILLPTCFSDTQIQSPVNQSQAHDVQALLYLNPLPTFIHKYTYIHTFTLTFPCSSSTSHIAVLCQSCVPWMWLKI